MPNELSSEAEGKLFDYHVEKSKQPHDWHWKEAQQISGLADYSEADAGMHYSDNKN